MAEGEPGRRAGIFDRLRRPAADMGDPDVDVDEAVGDETDADPVSAEVPIAALFDQDPAPVAEEPAAGVGPDLAAGIRPTGLRGDRPLPTAADGSDSATVSVERPSSSLAGAAGATGEPVPGHEGLGTEDDPAAPGASPFARPLPRVIAIANQKGGVGKTTTAVNLGACLAEIGYRVLVCDLDPQGNASTGLGLNPRNMASSMYDVILNDVPLEDCIEPSSVRNLFVAPASLDLAGAEIELVPAFSRELRLRRAIEPLLDEFDFVLIDCPPSLGLLTVNGLAAAAEVIVPIQCEYYALEGLGQLLRNVSLVQRNLNPRLEVSAIICVMYDARTKLSGQVVAEVRAHFGDKVCRNVVPRTVRLSEAPSFGQPIIAFDPTSRGAIAYRELAKEVSGGTPQRSR
jgi:chromosome partitioning protein